MRNSIDVNVVSDEFQNQSVIAMECFDIDHSFALKVDREMDYGFFLPFEAETSTNRYTRHPKCTEIDASQYLVQMVCHFGLRSIEILRRNVEIIEPLLGHGSILL